MVELQPSKLTTRVRFPPPALSVDPRRDACDTLFGEGGRAVTGIGAFDPFFSTKGPGNGTGLGLATVHGIVRQSGGFVSLDSTVGLGTEVAVCLPRTLEPAASSAAPDATVPAQAWGGELVLLVEDEPAVRSVCRVSTAGGSWARWAA